MNERNTESDSREAKKKKKSANEAANKWPGVVGSAIEQMETGNASLIEQGEDTLRQVRDPLPLDALSHLLQLENAAVREATYRLIARQFADQQTAALGIANALIRFDSFDPLLEATQALGDAPLLALFDAVHILLLKQGEGVKAANLGRLMRGRRPAVVQLHAQALKACSLILEGADAKALSKKLGRKVGQERIVPDETMFKEATFWTAYVGESELPLEEFLGTLEEELVLYMALSFLIRGPKHYRCTQADSSRALALRLLPNADLEYFGERIVEVCAAETTAIEDDEELLQLLAIAVIRAAGSEFAFNEGFSKDGWRQALGNTAGLLIDASHLQAEFEQVKHNVPEELHSAALNELGC